MQIANYCIGEINYSLSFRNCMQVSMSYVLKFCSFKEHNFVVFGPVIECGIVRGIFNKNDRKSTILFITFI